MINKNYNRRTTVRTSIIIIGLMTIFIIFNNNRYLSFSGEALWFILFFLSSILEFIANSSHTISKICFSSFFIAIYTFFSFLFTREHRSISTVVVLCMFFLSSFSWGVFRFHNREIRYFENCYIVSLVLVEILMIFQPEIYIRTKNRYTYQFLDNDPIDPNFLALFFVIGSIIVLNRMRDEKIKKFFYLSIFLITLLCILATGSRGGMLGLLVAVCVLYRTFLVDTIKRKPIAVPAIIIGFIIMLIIAWKYMPQDIKNRFFALSSYNDGSNQTRIRYWTNSLRAIKSHLFWGSGVIEFSQYHKDIFGMGGDAHNTFLAVLEIYGVIGSLPFFYLAYYEIIRSVKRKDHLNMAILLSLGIMGFIVNALVIFPFWLAFLYVHMRNFQKDEVMHN